MPVNLVERESTATAGNAATYFFGPLDYVANRLYLLATYAVLNAAVPTPTVDNGGALAWDLLGRADYDLAGQQGALFVFRFMPEQEVIQETFFIAYGVEMAGAGVGRSGFTGVPPGNNGANATGSTNSAVTSGDATALSVPLADVDPGNGVYAALGQDDLSDMTPDAGYTKIQEEHEPTESESFMAMWRPDPDTNPGATWSTPSQAGIIAVELVALPGGVGNPVQAILQGHVGR